MDDQWVKEVWGLVGLGGLGRFQLLQELLIGGNLLSSALEFTRDHVTFKLPYDFSNQMKTPKIWEVWDIYEV